MPYARQLLLATPAVRCQAVTLLHPRPGWSAPYRVASERLLITLGGSYGCSLGRGTWVCDSASALWLTPQEIYRLLQPSRAPGLLLELPGLAARAGRYRVSPGVHAALARWRRQPVAGSAEPLAAEERLLAVARDVLQDDGQLDGGGHPAVERARSYLAEHFDRNDTLEDIARAACCSPYHLARQFRRHAGTSLHAHRTRLRMVAALHRLNQGEADLSMLAADLGYSSHSHFSAVFAATYGQAPAAMRRILVAPPA